jgi:predicted GIY-YIG superfamily endonuclease
MREPKAYFVYIMTNRSKTLYTSITTIDAANKCIGPEAGK